MKVRTFLKVLGGAIILPATLGLPGCSAEIPSEATSGWRGPDPEADIRRWVLSYALLAPHSHNLQSWVADLRQPDEIVLRCDLSRLLPETDPYFRQIMMSHGTFLELLDLAARERGYKSDITLFPEGSFDALQLDARPVARIRLLPDASIQKDPLFAQILKRRTNRSIYDAQRAVPTQAWQAMSKALGSAAVLLDYVDLAKPEAMAQHRKIASDAWRIEMTTPRTILESYKVLRVGADEILKHRDGLSIMDPKLVWLDRLGLFDRSRAPAPDAYATTSQIKEFDAKIDSTPAFLWVKTARNDRVAQIAAGRAYARVQLAATAHGVAMQPLQQALQEYTEQQANHQAIHQLCGATPSGQTVQMWARVGFAPAVPAAPRRPLAEILRT
ncbi:MAG TPA: twin-arginine translocation pathway signal protein [Rhodoferax sp.]|nr:twin-arginine translocation pathway signal protein [Rhodoferax sp.]